MRYLRIAIAMAVVFLFTSEIFASSNPIPGVGVVIKRQPGSSQARTTTDKDGNFRFEGLEPGEYTITVQTKTQSVYVLKGDQVEAARGASGTGTTSDGTTGGSTGGTTEPIVVNHFEVAITSSDEISIDGKTKKAGDAKFFKDPETKQIVCTVGRDGVLSGQLRAGISTSRSNLRTK